MHNSVTLFKGSNWCWVSFGLNNLRRGYFLCEMRVSMCFSWFRGLFCSLPKLKWGYHFLQFSEKVHSSWLFQVLHGTSSQTHSSLISIHPWQRSQCCCRTLRSEHCVLCSHPSLHIRVQCSFSGVCISKKNEDPLAMGLWWQLSLYNLGSPKQWQKTYSHL